MSAYTRAAVFQPGASTRMLARFSTVAGEPGSPDMWRDARGFSLEFYTSEGNYDLVDNNFHQLPVNRPVNDAGQPYVFDGNMAFEHSGSAPVYAPNSDVLERALTYWRNVDDAVGQRIADAVNAKT